MAVNSSKVNASNQVVRDIEDHRIRIELVMERLYRLFQIMLQKNTTTTGISSKANGMKQVVRAIEDHWIRTIEDHWIRAEHVMEHLHILFHIILFNILIIGNFDTEDQIITPDINNVLIRTGFTTYLMVDSLLHCITMIMNLAAVEIAVIRALHWRKTVNYVLSIKAEQFVVQLSKIIMIPLAKVPKQVKTFAKAI